MLVCFHNIPDLSMQAMLSVSGVCLEQETFFSSSMFAQNGENCEEMENLKKSWPRVIAESVVEWGSVTVVTQLHLYVPDCFLDCELLGDMNV